jgi:MFS family permease
LPRPRLLPDLSPFRDSRDLRLVVGGNFVGNLGAQATLVALPFQLYVQTRSAFLVGLLGAVELVPLVAMSLFGGALADRMDRRRLLLADQIGVFLAAGSLAVVFTVLPLAPQPPDPAGSHASVVRSIAEGLRYVRGNRALIGSFAIDLVAMTFGLPRALFAVLAVGVYHAGAGGTGVLYASVSAGATVAAVLTGWLNHARRLGLIVIWAVLVWGVAIALAGLMGSLWLAAAMLAIAGAADSISSVCRSTINQTVTPDRMRGRMSAVFSLVVSGGPRLGDIESGTVAGARRRPLLRRLRRIAMPARGRPDRGGIPAAGPLRLG